MSTPIDHIETSARNALLVHHRIEEALDAYRVVIVAVSTSTPFSFKCILCDKGIENEGVAEVADVKTNEARAFKWSDLDGKFV